MCAPVLQTLFVVTGLAGVAACGDTGEAESRFRQAVVAQHAAAALMHTGFRFQYWAEAAGVKIDSRINQDSRYEVWREDGELRFEIAVGARDGSTWTWKPTRIAVRKSELWFEWNAVSHSATVDQDRFAFRGLESALGLFNSWTAMTFVHRDGLMGLLDGEFERTVTESGEKACLLFSSSRLPRYRYRIEYMRSDPRIIHSVSSEIGTMRDGKWHIQYHKMLSLKDYRDCGGLQLPWHAEYWSAAPSDPKDEFSEPSKNFRGELIREEFSANRDEIRKALETEVSYPPDVGLVDFTQDAIFRPNASAVILDGLEFQMGSVKVGIPPAVVGADALVARFNWRLALTVCGSAIAGAGLCVFAARKRNA